MRDITYPSVIYDMPEAEYHARPEMSKGRLWPINQSAAHFRWNITRDRSEDKPSDALRMGTLADELILSPDTFEDRYFVDHFPPPPPGDKRKKEIKAQYADWAEAKLNYMLPSEGKEVITGAEFIKICHWAYAVNSVPEARVMLEHTQKQVSLFWEDSFCGTGLPCKARLDMWGPDIGPMMGDLKTAREGSPEGFSKACSDLGYYIQDAHYREGVKACIEVDPKAMVFLVVEKSPPYCVGMYHLTESARTDAQELYQMFMHEADQALRSDRYPGYPPGINPIDLPPWGVRRFEARLDTFRAFKYGD